MSKVDWNRVSENNRMRRNGTEDAADGTVHARGTGLRRGPSKEQLRREADALLAKANVTVQRLPAAKPGDLFGHRPARKEPVATPIRSTIDRAVPPGLVIYADGCCIPNPGIGGWGFVVYNDCNEVYSECGGDLVATNQTMELTAALRALEWIIAQGFKPPVALISDSKYVVDGCNSWRLKWKAMGWKRGGPNTDPRNSAIANIDLWKALDAALTLVPIKIEWCAGHAGITGNERADQLSTEGRASVATSPSQRMIMDQLQYFDGGVPF